MSMIENLILPIIVILLSILWAVFFFCLKGIVNPVKPDRSIRISQQARDLHSQILVADLHADSLLYRNSILKKSRQGQVDIPRLLEGNVGLQVFTCVSKFPLDGNINRSNSGRDLVTPLAILHGWPRRTWGSSYERAVYQIQKLKTFERESQGRLKIIRCQTDLQAWEQARANHQPVVAAVAGLEGGHCLEGRLEALDLLFQEGYRLLSPTHFFDNELGGSLHGAEKGGLTPFGRQVIARMLALNMIIDLAHASEAMMTDILAMVDRPVILSHTGVKEVCDNNRNLADEFICKIARTGGVIGIGFWDEATGSGRVRDIARSMRCTADRVGVEHVALGSDFDGFVRAPFDCSQMVQVTQALLEEGFSSSEISLIMGGNVLRVLSALLP
jgi:microsomal dipeptidase-like Zn-dependent dipeptidase